MKKFSSTFYGTRQDEKEGILMSYRLATFERYIHTNACNDEGGWFAYFCPDGSATDSFDVAQKSGLYTNGWETEEQAIQDLIRIACGLSKKYAEGR